jgi:hypothetical protein
MLSDAPSGVTPSEQYLDRLCKRSFLSLWSYPNLYRDQGRKNDKGDGKELADHLIIFNEHIIIFSDKSCAFPDSGDVELDWSRWYRRSIEKSAEQASGTERWLLQHPDRIFLDRECTKPLPISIEPGCRIHKIVIALNASERCKKFFGNSGSGSLVLSANVEGGTKPFHVGNISKSNGFVHILDDVTLDIVLGELDTITDFTDYLSRKEALFRSRLCMAAGEEELLAYYLTHTNRDKQHDFEIDKTFDAAYFDEGSWSSVRTNPLYIERKAADRQSYAWDEIIEKFSRNVLAGTLASGNDRPISDHERGLRVLASEGRHVRRNLAKALFDLLGTTPKDSNKMRMVLSKQIPERAYVLLIAGQETSHPDYREKRADLLSAYCYVAKADSPGLMDIVGISTEPADYDSRSEDLFYLDARKWDDDAQKEALELKKNTGLMTKLTKTQYHDKEYPRKKASVQARTNRNKKRNALKEQRNKWKAR